MQFLPALLDADAAALPSPPWSAIIAGAGVLLNIIGALLLRNYKHDLDTLAIKAGTAIAQAAKAEADAKDAKAAASTEIQKVRVELAAETNERLKLDGRFLAMQADHDAREDMRDKLVTRNGFEERTDRQDMLLQQMSATSAVLVDMVEKIGRKTGSIQSMPAVRQPPIPRRDSTDPPPPRELPPMRPRLPSRGKYGAE